MMITKNDLLKYKNLMVKSNYIIEASYKLNLQEQRIIYILTSKIDKDDIDFKACKFTQNEISKILLKHKITFNELSQYIDNLRNRELVIIKEKSILKTKWLSSAEYFEDGSIELCFDNKLKPYLLQLKNRFTKLSLDKMITFNSNYSCRIYELLKQYQGIGERILSIEALRTMFCIEPQQYKLYGDFKRKVLLQAQKEINNHSDVFFNFEEIKTGRKVTSIKFIITSDENKSRNEIAASSTSSELEENQDLIKQVQAIFVKHDITEYEAKCMLKDSNNNIDLIRQCYNYLLNKNVKNIVGYMRKLVKDFKDPQGNSSATFNNFKQRNYDFKDLEKKLLGWD